MMLFFSGGVMVLFFYLYFVAFALVMDNLPLHMAVAQSFTVVRKNFWSTLAFIADKRSRWGSPDGVAANGDSAGLGLPSPS